MNFRIIIQLFFSIVLGLCLLAPVARSQDAQSPSPEPSVDRPLNMLVLGDSIIWGQALRTEHKSWYQIKMWLAQNTGRAVRERVEAHAGAVIEVGRTEDDIVSVDGEVKVPVPSVINQVERALRDYPDGTQVDLVLVSGCINDVGTTILLNAANTPEEIRLRTQAKCGLTMERLLRRITSSFPTAYVIVTGYYPFVSEQTRRDLFTKAFAKGFYQALPGASSLSQELIFKRMIANSHEWYRSSNKSLGEAVKRVNAEFNGTKSQGRVMFAEIPFRPEHSFRAPKTQLWNFEGSVFRKLMVILSFGKILPRTNDEMRKQRAASCKEFWKPLPNETPPQKKEKKNQELLCRYGALGHPNRKGALTYAEAIKDQLKTVYPVWGSSRALCKKELDRIDGPTLYKNARARCAREKIK